MRNKKIFLFLIILIFLGNVATYGKEVDVYVVPIKGNITRGSYNFLRSSLEDIDAKESDLIVFEIDTYGGLIDEAIKIKDLIMSLNCQTVSYVNNKAESAGVLITIASEKVAMSEGGTIGSAETIPKTEKVLSMWSGILRGTAQKRGRDPEIIESMADRSIAIDGIVEKGKLLNLSSEEALNLGISDYKVQSLEELLKVLGFNGFKVKVIEEGVSLKLSRIIGKPSFTNLFVFLAIMGLVVELMTPGVGLGSVVSLISIGFFIGGNIVAGYDIPTAILFLVVGGILLLIEFIIPGFGLAGISGIIFVMLGIVIVSQILKLSVLSMLMILIVLFIFMIYILRRTAKSKRIEKIVLKKALSRDKGYTSSEPKSDYLGKIGKTKTDLRPSGYVEIEGEILDVLSDGEYIKKETRVKVIRVEGSKIIVRRV